MDSQNGKIMGFVVAGVAPAILFFMVTSISGWAGGLSGTGPLKKAEQPAAKGEVKDIPILQKWSGDFPVAQIERLPADQREERGRRRGGVRSLRGLHREMKTREFFFKRLLTPASPMGMGDIHKYEARADQDFPGHAGRPGAG
jgi:hypothetical protein